MLNDKMLKYYFLTTLTGSVVIDLDSLVAICTDLSLLYTKKMPTKLKYFILISALL